MEIICACGYLNMYVYCTPINPLAAAPAIPVQAVRCALCTHSYTRKAKRTSSQFTYFITTCYFLLRVSEDLRHRQKEAG